MGFIHPLALLALPLALLPLLLSWRGRRRGEPKLFSSLLLFDEARRRPLPLRARRRRNVLLLRVLTVALLVLAAARPVGPGRGGPADHRPTSAVVAIDVSASVGQSGPDGRAWSTIRAWGDSILALATREDRVALAAVADGVIGWWTGPPETLRRRLAGLEPSARASDWPATLRDLEARVEDGTEAYLLTDGAAGSRPPEPATRPRTVERPRALRVWPAPRGENRALVAARWTAAGRVSLAGRDWDHAEAAVAGRLRGSALVDSAAIPLDGGFGAASWAVADSATFAWGGGDRLAADDRLYVARGSAVYRVARLGVVGEPPESGPLFWEAALAASVRSAVLGRVRQLGELATDPPDLALLPIRAYRADEARALAELAERGTRLLFVPLCPAPACIPAGGWLPSTELAVPDVHWGLDDPDRRTTLTGGPGTKDPVELPEPLLRRAPVRGALEALGGGHADWTWNLATGEPALWVRGPVALWLIPLGPPVTHLATTPLFPLVAEAVMTAWDARWRGAGALRPGDRAPVPVAGATVTGPLGAPDPTAWTVVSGASPPRLERPGLYRIEGEKTTFLAVNGDPAEGNLAPVDPELWLSSWGARPSPPGDWQDQLFRRRRGPELWPWAAVLALAGLVGEAWVRRAGVNN